MTHSLLVVEDDRDLRQIHRMLFEKAGYTIFEAANGAEAMQFLMNQTPDVIILDMLMPMLGGEAVIQRIRQMPSLNNVHVVILTAYPRFQQTAFEHGIDHFLVKPVKPEELLSAVEMILA